MEEINGETVDNRDYIKWGVQPTSIHKSKTDHKAAVFNLIDGITQEIDDPGSTDVETKFIYDTVMEEAADRVYNRNNLVEDEDPISLSVGSVPLTEMQVEKLSESDYPISYQGGARLQVPSEELEEWVEEQEYAEY